MQCAPNAVSLITVTSRGGNQLSRHLDCLLLVLVFDSCPLVFEALARCDGNQTLLSAHCVVGLQGYNCWLFNYLRRNLSNILSPHGRTCSLRLGSLAELYLSSSLRLSVWVHLAHVNGIIEYHQRGPLDSEWIGRMYVHALLAGVDYLAVFIELNSRNDITILSLLEGRVIDKVKHTSAHLGRWLQWRNAKLLIRLSRKEYFSECATFFVTELALPLNGHKVLKLS